MKQIINLSILCVLLGAGSMAAGETIKLATSENRPYIGGPLENNGYVYELVTKIFRRIGYKVEIDFLPWARAVHTTKDGEYDGIMPIYYDKTLADQFVFSDPFPGGLIGLLKRKELGVSYEVDPVKEPDKTLRSLQDYVFGVVRDSVYTPKFDRAEFLKKEAVTTNVLNLKKLAGKRVDFIVIDKYTAADLMTHQLPHLIGHLEFMEPPLAKRAFHVAFSRHLDGYEQKVTDFNEALQQIQEDGTLDEILSKYGLLESTNSESGKTVIRIGTVDNPDMVIMQRLSQEYEQHNPNVKLEWKVLDENILRQRLMGDLAISDGKFDVMTIGAYEIPIWAEREWILPIHGLPESYDLNDVLQTVRDSLSSHGELYALPFYAESSMTFYRKDLFEKAGITMPERPSYDEIKKFAAAIHAPEENLYGVCLRGKAGWGENTGFVTVMVNSFGGRWFDEHWKPTIQSPEWRRAVTFYNDLLTNYGAPTASTNGFTENLRLFANGQCGIWIDATVAAGMVFNSNMSKVADKVGFAQAPVAVTPKGSHWLWIWALAIPSSSKVPDEALKFIAWATSQEYIEHVAAREGWISVPPGTRNSTYQNKNYQREAPFSEFVLASIQTADPIDFTLKPVPYTGIAFVAIPEFPALGTQVGQLMSRMLEGELSVEQVLQDAQKLVANQMRDSGYLK